MSDSSDFQDYLIFRSKLVTELNKLDNDGWQRVLSHYGIPPRIAEDLKGDGDETLKLLERKPRVIVRESDEDEFTQISNIRALEFVTDILSDDIRLHFEHLCQIFQERAHQRNLTRVVGDGIKQNPELLNSIALAFITNMFSGQHQNEFQTLYHTFLAREQINLLTNGMRDSKISTDGKTENQDLMQIAHYAKSPSAVSYDLVRRHQKLELKAYFFYGRVDSWRIGYHFSEYVDGSPVKEGDEITEEEAEEVLEHQMKMSGFKVNSLTHPMKLTQNQFDALCSFLIAIGLENFTSSTLLKKLRINPNDPDIRTEFRKWKYHRAKAPEGEERKHVLWEEFVKRREEELELYFKKDSSSD